jgi:hypothetical protein
MGATYHEPDGHREGKRDAGGGLVRRSAPLPYLQCTLPKPIAVILGGVGDGVDRFSARIFPRQWQYGLPAATAASCALITAVSPNLASNEHTVLAELEKSTYNFGGPLCWREGQRTAQKEQAT